MNTMTQQPTTFGNRVASSAIVASGQTATLSPQQIAGRANIMVWTSVAGSLLGLAVGVYAGMHKHR